MNLTAIALILTGIWLVVASQETPSTVLTLIFGIAVAICGVLQLGPLVGYVRRD